MPFHHVDANDVLDGKGEGVVVSPGEVDGSGECGDGLAVALGGAGGEGAVDDVVDGEADVAAGAVSTATGWLSLLHATSVPTNVRPATATMRNRRLVVRLSCERIMRRP